jgi:ubiquinone/menaquinone biosynthesis C-methylase UbiE
MIPRPIKTVLKHIYLWPLLPADRVNYFQEKIRKAEWEAVKPFIPAHSKFLDVGCGAGYNMKTAREELFCDVTGIDPDPGAHGVGRYSFHAEEAFPIDKGFSEQLPYENEHFDVVFCSHVLEHVKDTRQSLEEMKRVLKPGGTLVIGMPTATMSWVGLFSQLLFTTHIRWFNFFTQHSDKGKKIKFLLLPASHSEENKTVLYDIHHYRVKRWRKIITEVFQINQILLPALYPYPDFRQFFRQRKSVRFGSSVFFICSKPA